MPSKPGVRIEPLALPEVKLVTPAILRDERGFFSETFNARSFDLLPEGATFVQDNHSLSVPRGVVRGLHLQLPPRAQDKLVRVVRGSIFDVAVDVRRGSLTFGHHVGVTLSADDWCQLFVPKGFAHGFCTLEANTEVIYKVTDTYAPECECGIAWDDPDIGIDWPVARGEAILSAKDARLPRLAHVRGVLTDMQGRAA